MQLRQEQILYRTIQRTYLPEKLESGKIWYEDFMSTSFDPQIVNSKTFGLGINQRDCLIKITAPKGAYRYEFNPAKEKKRRIC